MAESYLGCTEIRVLGKLPDGKPAEYSISIADLLSEQLQHIHPEVEEFIDNAKLRRKIRGASVGTIKGNILHATPESWESLKWMLEENDVVQAGISRVGDTNLVRLTYAPAGTISDPSSELELEQRLAIESRNNEEDRIREIATCGGLLHPETDPLAVILADAMGRDRYQPNPDAE